MAYKHKVSGEYYDMGEYSNYNGKITGIFKPWNKELNNIKIIADWVINTDLKMTDEKLSAGIDANDLAFKNKVNEIFDIVCLKPKIAVDDVPKYVKVEVKLNCPICNSPLKRKGGAYLTSPLQYDHKCTNPNCEYHTCISRWYAGKILFAKSKEDAYRIITSGTEYEKDELENREEE